MQFYNKIMLYFWIAAGFVILIGVTIMGFMDGFEIWMYYYLFAGLCFLMFFVRRWMMKRYEKHLKWLEEQNEKEAQQ